MSARVLKISFDLKSRPLGGICIVLYLSSGKEGQSSWCAGNANAEKEFFSAHGSLVEMLWDEVGTRFIFQTRTYPIQIPGSLLYGK